MKFAIFVEFVDTGKVFWRWVVLRSLRSISKFSHALKVLPATNMYTHWSSCLPWLWTLCNLRRKWSASSKIKLLLGREKAWSRQVFVLQNKKNFLFTKPGMLLARMLPLVGRNDGMVTLSCRWCFVLDVLSVGIGYYHIPG